MVWTSRVDTSEATKRVFFLSNRTEEEELDISNLDGWTALIRMLEISEWELECGVLRLRTLWRHDCRPRLDLGFIGEDVSLHEVDCTLFQKAEL